MNRKSFSANLALFIFSLTVSAVLCETVLRALPVSDKIGWNSVPSLEQRVEKLNLKPGRNIVCLGDSFIEWRAGSAVNMLDIVQRNLPEASLLNLGRGGTDLDRYVEAYERYVRFEPDLVILFLYLGNDIRPYPPLAEIEKLPALESRGSLKDILKRHSILLNTVFRLLKVHVPFMRSGFYERNLRILQKQENLPDDYIASRESKVNPAILKLAKGDAVNPLIVSKGMVYPDSYRHVFSMQSGTSWADATLSLIEEFRQKHRIKRFAVVFIPESLQVSSSYDAFFQDCGFNLKDFPMDDRRRVTAYLDSRLREAGYKTLDLTPFLESEGDAYLSMDIHFNAKGHRITADQVIDLIRSEL